MIFGSFNYDHTPWYAVDNFREIGITYSIKSSNT